MSLEPLGTEFSGFFSVPSGFFVLIDASNDWHVRRVSKVNIVLKCRSLCYTKNNSLFDRFCNKERQ